jgi:hypothetical protein
VASIDTRRIPLLLAAATLIPIGALSWLGFRTLQQDRELERQRRRERLEVAAGRLALDVERRLQTIEEQLATGSGIWFLPTAIESGKNQPILYQPDQPLSLRAVTTPALAAAEVQEFQDRDLDSAARAYRRLAASQEPTVRAAALVGLGRVLRQRGDRQGAPRPTPISSRSEPPRLPASLLRSSRARAA